MPAQIYLQNWNQQLKMEKIMHQSLEKIYTALLLNIFVPVPFSMMVRVCFILKSKSKSLTAITNVFF